MAELDISLQRLRITKGSLNTGVAQEPLDLFKRHPALQGKRSGGVTEDMRRDVAGDIAP